MGEHLPLTEAPGLTDLVAKLADDAREVARAEIGLYRAKLMSNVPRYKAAAICFAAAGTIGLAALVALLVGLILSIATMVGPGWATAIVIGVSFAIVAILGLAGRAQLSAPVVRA